MRGCHTAGCKSLEHLEAETWKIAFSSEKRSQTEQQVRGVCEKERREAWNCNSIKANLLWDVGLWLLLAFCEHVWHLGGWSWLEITEIIWEFMHSPTIKAHFPDQSRHAWPALNWGDQLRLVGRLHQVSTCKATGHNWIGFRLRVVQVQCRTGAGGRCSAGESEPTPANAARSITSVNCWWAATKVHLGQWSA